MPASAPFDKATRQPTRAAPTKAEHMTLHRVLSCDYKAKLTPAQRSRVGGLPPGIRPHRWPSFYDPERQTSTLGTHLLTVDASELEIAAAPGVLAYALFMSDPQMPRFFDDPTSDLEVVALTAADLQAQDLSGLDLPKPLRAGALRFEPVPEGELQRLRYSGDFPRFIHEPWERRPWPDFILMIDDYFMDINLGDSGRLSMFTTWAMWESH